jgi:ABC-type transport system substrate-binding protein
MESAEALDPHNVLITWRTPFYLASTLGVKLLWPLPAHILAAEYAGGDVERFINLPYWTSEYVHTGPFRLARFEPGGSAVFEAHERYYLGRPRLDTVIIRQVLDANVLHAAILAGELDLTMSLVESDRAEALQAQWVDRGLGRLAVVRGATFSLFYQFAPEYIASRDQLDPRVRRALSLSVDRAGVAELVLSRQAQFDVEAKAFVVPTHPLYPYIQDVFANSAGDSRRALQLFAETGWIPGRDELLTNTEGRHLPMEVTSGPLREKLVTAVADMWRRVGVDGRVAIQPPARNSDLEYLGSYSGAELTGSGDSDRTINRFSVPIPSARNSFAGSNRGHYENPELADLQARYRTATQEAEQGALIRRIADLFTQEAPLLVLYYNPVFATLRTGVSALDDFGGGHVGGGYFGSYPRTSHLWNKD